MVRPEKKFESTEQNPNDEAELSAAKIENQKIRESNIKEISKELDNEFAMILNEEISELEKISTFAESVASKLQKHYSNMFPKKCNTCNRTYKDREQYLEETRLLQKTSTVYDEVG